MGFAYVADGFCHAAEPIHWALKERFLRYDDFETILMAPAAFIRANADCARQFDRCLPYEELAMWIPLFAKAVGIPEQV